MLLIDVNVLLYAYRNAAPEHKSYLQWLEGCINSDQPFGLAELVLSGFLRIATHPKIFSPPSPLEPAIGFVDALRGRSNCVIVAPGPRHWDIFSRLCRAANAKGNLIPDAYLAALAIESGTEWITADRDFSRFPGLRWRHPLD
jgi:toxin-antitoxin system PIN domain toxin